MIKSMIWLALANLCRGDSSAMDDNKQFWERFSRHYAGFMRRSQATYQQICKAMRPFLKRDMDVLELACGTGQLSVPLSPCVRSWEATDFSSEMIRQAKKQVYSSRLHFSVQDATKLPYGPESFDAVVLGCTHYPHAGKAIAEFFTHARFYDGCRGTAAEAARRLESLGMCTDTRAQGGIEYITTSDNPGFRAICERLMQA